MRLRLISLDVASTMPKPLPCHHKILDCLGGKHELVDRDIKAQSSEMLDYVGIRHFHAGTKFRSKCHSQAS